RKRLNGARWCASSASSQSEPFANYCDNTIIGGRLASQLTSFRSNCSRRRDQHRCWLCRIDEPIVLVTAAHYRTLTYWVYVVTSELLSPSVLLTCFYSRDAAKRHGLLVGLGDGRAIVQAKGNNALRAARPHVDWPKWREETECQHGRAHLPRDG